MKVKTIQTHAYPPHISRTIGEEYEMQGDHYPVMSAMGHVVRIEESPVTSRDLGAEQPKKYKRRDMRAQD